MFETTEGFVKSGARDVTHEELDEEEDDSEFGTTEIFETIKTVINKEESILENDDYGILKILVTFLDTFGIKLEQNNVEDLFKKIELEITNNIKEKELWMASLDAKQRTKKREKLEEKYNAYVTINTIYFTVSYLFIYLQTSIPEYTITKSHPECVPTLAGYPLSTDDTDQRGIDYITCILQNLIRGGQEYTVLKKAKGLKGNIIRTIEKLLDDHFIKSLYDKKREYLIHNKGKIVELKTVLSKWNEFRPPMNDITTSLDQLNSNDFNQLVRNLYNSDISSNDINELILKYKENCFLYSSDLIKIYNFYTNLSDIENVKYFPTPLDNTCCLTNIDNFSFDNFYSDLDVDHQITKIKEELDNLHAIFPIINNFPINSQYHVKSIYKKKYLESFRRDIFPIQPSESDIIDLHLNYVSDGMYLGFKRIYDSDDTCIITGESKKDLLKKTYLLSDYNSLLRNIIDQRRITIPNIVYQKSNTIDKIKLLVGSNPLIASNQVFNNSNIETLGWLNRLERTYIEAGWSDTEFDEELFSGFMELVNPIWENLENEIQIDRNEIIDTISQKLNLNRLNIEELKLILVNIGISPNQEEEYLNEISEFEMEEKMPEIMEEKYKQKVINIKNIFKKILIFFSRLLQDSEFTDEEFNNLLPKNWKVDNTQYSRLKNLYKAHVNNLRRLIDVDKSLIQFSISIINKCNKNIDDLYSNNIERLNDFDYQKCSLILEYLFFNMIRNLLFLSNSEGTGEDLNEDLESEPVLNLNDNFTKLSKSQKKHICNITYEFLKSISFEKNLFNKYTKKQIQKNIKKEAENSKERNLEFIGELDKEARQSLKLLLNVGLEVWKDISVRRGGEKYNDPSFEEEPIDDNLTDEELRFNATAQLGENYTEEQYNEWLENRQSNLLQEQEIHSEIVDGYLEEDDDEHALNYEE